MSQKQYALVTALGQAMIAESIRTGADIDLEMLAVGDREYSPSEGQTALMNERVRVSLAEIVRDADNPSWLRCTAVLPPDVGGFQIHEAGLITRNGNLFAVAKMDGSYKPVYADGMVKEIAIDFVIEVASEAKVTLVADPHAIIATQKWVRSLVEPLPRQLRDEFTAADAALATELNSHTGRKDNPHEVKAAQVGAYSKAEVDARDEAINDVLTVHLNQTDNPHSVNADQVGAYSRAQVDALLAALLPPGFVLPFAANAIPTGWLKANGAAISRTTYAKLFANIGAVFGAGDGSTTFNLPDLRGVFVRGFDDGRGQDPGRTIGSYQTDAVRNIVGKFGPCVEEAGATFAGPFYDAGQGAGANAEFKNRIVGFDASRAVPTAADNRPKNVALLYCIKY